MISIGNVTRRFRRGAETVTAVDDVSLDLYPGELTVAAGPSGSGKTTLLRVLAGLEVPDSGAVFAHEDEVTHRNARERDGSASVKAGQVLHGRDDTRRNVPAMPSAV